MREADIKAIMSGERRGIVAGVIRRVLEVGSVGYRAGVGYRNWRFDAGRGVHAAAVPVVSVGNLTAGGTGKTPVVAALANYFREQGIRVALLSRGYHALPPNGQLESAETSLPRYVSSASSGNDEGRVLEWLCPGTPHYQQPNRVRSAHRAIAAGAQLLILDDGFQHRRLARDLDIVLIDATNPFGYGHLLPRGLLREPLSALQRAQLVIITRSDLVPRRVVEQITQTIHACNSVVPVVYTAFPATSLVNAARERQPLANFRQQRLLAFCGIGNPQGFAATLSAAGLTTTQLQIYPDHHHYSGNDVRQLLQICEEQRCDQIVTTLKDLVKIPGELPLSSDRSNLTARESRDARQAPIWAVEIGLELRGNSAAWQAALEPLVERVTSH